MLSGGKVFIEKGLAPETSVENIHDLVWDGSIFHQWESIGI
jgi:hypothetical protein